MIGKIYKSGQGYWTRLLTGIGTGALIIGAVVWLWNKIEGQMSGSDYKLYIQGAVALFLISVLGSLVYWLVGSRQKSCEFLIATEAEMKKVNWPTRREIIGSTWIVICCTFLLVSVLLLADVFFSDIFTLIGVLEARPALVQTWCIQRSISVIAFFVILVAGLAFGVITSAKTIKQHGNNQAAIPIGLVLIHAIGVIGYVIMSATVPDSEKASFYISTVIGSLIFAVISGVIGFVAGSLFLTHPTDSLTNKQAT